MPWPEDDHDHVRLPGKGCLILVGVTVLVVGAVLVVWWLRAFGRAIGG